MVFKIDISDRGLVSSVLAVLSGAAGGQALTLLLSPIVTRIYSPEAFGTYSSFMAIVAIIAPVSALCYPVAIILPKEKDEALEIAGLSLRLSIMSSLFVLIIIVFFSGEYTKFPDQLPYTVLFFLPVAMLLTSMQQIFQHLSMREKSFRRIGKAALFQSIGVNTFKIGGGAIHPSAIILISATQIGTFIHSVALSHKLIFLTVVKKTFLVGGKLQLALKYKDFPSFRSPQVLINAVSQGLPVLLLATFATPAAAGFFALAKTTLTLPSILISKAVADVFYPHITEMWNNNQQIRSELIKVIVALSGLGFLPFSLVVVFGPFLFSFVFGENWNVAGEYARWMGLWLYAFFIVRPCVTVIPLIKLNKFFLFYEVVGLLIRLGGMLVGMLYLESALIAIVIYCLSGVFLNIFLGAFVLNRANSHDMRR